MERLKSKTTLLVAVVLAAVLAMAGVGYALANPNNSEENAGISTQAEDNPIYGLTYEQVKAKYPDAMCQEVIVTNEDQFILYSSTVYLNIYTPKNVVNDGIRLFVIDNAWAPNPETYKMVAYDAEANRIYNCTVMANSVVDPDAVTEEPETPEENESNEEYIYEVVDTWIDGSYYAFYRDGKLYLSTNGDPFNWTLSINDQEVNSGSCYIVFNDYYIVKDLSSMSLSNGDTVTLSGKAKVGDEDYKEFGITVSVTKTSANEPETPGNPPSTSEVTTVDCMAHRVASAYPNPSSVNNEQIAELLGIDSSEVLRTLPDGSTLIDTLEGVWAIYEPSGAWSGYPGVCKEQTTISASDPSTEGAIAAFNFNFKATGIQSTGFNDYHEAFAALNN